MTTIDLTARDISCGHCKSSIEQDLGATPGIRHVNVDIESKAVHVDFYEGQISPADIRTKLDEIGYPAA